MDRISNLPLSLLETILCLLPYQDVVRTSTLSKEWRYHWTNITKIMVIEDYSQTLNQQQRRINISKLLRGAGQALLMHTGPIQEFTLSVVTNAWGNNREIDCIMSHLSRKKTVKKLTVDFVEWSASRGKLTEFLPIREYLLLLTYLESLKIYIDTSFRYDCSLMTKKGFPSSRSMKFESDNRLEHLIEL
ncbi:F-box/FBD/LRR-repeat protein [Tanacetum coccineum]|uniref:F-box/FBD/LRR-repeat protein n=1 Tax=Tanacetum coccineum TaxID=301880 RepID=A0ABQ5C145_9ASTR